MHSTSYIASALSAAALLAGTASAVPAPPVPVGELPPEFNATTPEESHRLLKRYDAHTVSCDGSTKTHSQAIPIGSGFGWTVWIPQPIGLNPDGYCGDNFLNYLRAQSGACATSSSYQCQPVTSSDGSGQGVLIGFDTNIFCGAGQVQKAIWDSTNPQLQNECANHGQATSPSDVVGAIIGVLGAIGWEIGTPTGPKV